MWLTYDTSLSFEHKLHDEKWVKDKECLTTHEHIDSPIHVELKVIREVPFDFKNLKEAVEQILDRYRNKDITTHFQLTTCEDFTRTLHGDIELKMRQRLQVPSVDVRVHIQETKKYGVTID